MIDFLGQLVTVAEDPNLVRNARTAINGMRRGVVALGPDQP